MKLSIITPSFNQLDWLKLCLASVADQVATQTTFQVEHVIQDGGSEGFESFTKEMLQLYPDGKDYTLRFFSQKDSGMYDALNKGFAKAGGEIVAWLNCDEQYLPASLSKVAECFEQEAKLDVLLGDALLLDAEQNMVAYRRIMKPLQWHTRLAHLHSLSCAMFFRRRLMKGAELFDPQWKIIGDAVLVDQWIGQGLRIKTLGEPLSCYSITGVNLSLDNKVNKEHDRWLQELSGPPLWMRWPTVYHHRLRRLWAGGYRKRKLQTAVFTHRSPSVRVHAVSEKLGWSWPNARSY